MTEKPLSPLASLEYLSRIFPIQGAAIVGAGMGQGAWFELLKQKNIDNVLLIEADETHLKYLRKTYSNHADWNILQCLINDTPGEATFYRYSNSAEHSLLDPSHLKELWPNITPTETVCLKPLTLDSLNQKIQLQFNWLIIDILPAITVLKGAVTLFENIDVLITREILDSTINSEKCQDISSLIKNQGFLCIGTEAELHPAIGHALYVRAPQHLAPQLKQTQRQLESLQKELHKKESAWNAEKNTLQHAAEKVIELKQQIQQLSATLEAKEEELNKTKLAQTELAQCDKQQKVWMEQILAKQTKTIQKQFDKQNDELHHVSKFIKSTLSKELFKATNHIESFWSAEHYFATGITPTLPTEMTKWPISPDLAMLLINLIESNTYDLVIEFGSGISTIVIAKALLHKAFKDHNTIAKFVSFEHNKDYYEKTLSQLKNNDLDQTVELKLTPLAPFTATDNNTYSYYDCQFILKKLWQKFEGSHILVFVDGPPGSTGKNSRYPALSHMLPYSDAVKIDMLLDDTIRSDEQEIVKCWQDELRLKKKNPVVNRFNLDKGVTLLQFGY